MASSRKLIVEVVGARDLMPKDEHGSSSPYVMIDYYGQRKKTQTAIRDLNPSWNEVLEFNVGNPSEVLSDMLELDVYHDKNYGSTRRNNFLGRLPLSSSRFVKKGEEALIYYPLERKSLLTWVQGVIGLKIYYVDAVPVPPPIPPPVQNLPVPEEAKSDEKVVAPSKSEPSPPADEKTSEEPPSDEAKAETEAAGQPPAPENAAPEGNKEAQPEPPPLPPPQQFNSNLNNLN